MHELYQTPKLCQGEKWRGLRRDDQSLRRRRQRRGGGILYNLKRVKEFFLQAKAIIWP